MDAARLRKSIAKKMKALSIYLKDPFIRKEKDEFLEKFMLCEAACKEILSAYFKEKGKSINNSSIKLDMVSIPSAMKKAGYPLSKALLTGIFGASRTRGKKSAKKLRDGIVHSLSKEDINEVIDRRMQLHKMMDEFLSVMCTPPPGIAKKAKKPRKALAVKKAA